MTRMVRKQVYIEPEHDQLLKQRSAQWGVTESELIRRGIDQVIRAPRRWARDDQAWQEALAFMRARAALSVVGVGEERGWKREDLYDERRGGGGIG